MRPAPLTARLLLVAHGSADPRYPATIEAIAASVRQRTSAPVAVAYLDHLEPRLAEVATAGDIVVPLLLSTGFHATVDIPAAAPDSLIAAPLGPDRRLAVACADRLIEAGWTGDSDVILAAAGSSDPAASADVATAAEELDDELRTRGYSCSVCPAFLSAGVPKLADVVTTDTAVVTYLLAPGSFADQAAAAGAAVVTGVLGDHPSIADIALDRATHAAS